MEAKQPVGYPRCFVFKIVIRGGKKGTGRPRLVDIQIPAKLLVPRARYSAGMTVGHGHYHDYERTDPAGSPVFVTGFFDDGTVSVHGPGGGVARLSKADIQILEWSNDVPLDERELYEAMPAHPHEMVLDNRHENISGKDYCCSHQFCGMWERRN